MNYVLHNEPDYYIESLHLLNHIYNGSGIPDIKENMLQKNGDERTKEELLLSLNKVETLEKKLQKIVKKELKKEKARLLFSENDSLKNYYFDIFCRYYNLLGRGSATKQEAIYHFVDNHKNFTQNASSLVSEQQFFQDIQTLPIDKGAKYDILNIYYNFDEYEGYLDKLVGAATSVIKEELPNFEDDIQKLLNIAKSELETKGIHFLNRYVSVELSEGEIYNIYPTICEPTTIRLSILDYHSVATIAIGIGIYPLTKLSEQEKKDSAEVTDFFKALSDPTKLLILTKLKDQSYYSTQLADMLNLSGPTISHHMNILIKLRIVTIRKQGKRVYYELNKEQFKKYLSSINKMFLD